MRLEPFLPSYIKINSKWITVLNVRTKTIKVPNYNVGPWVRKSLLRYDIKITSNEKKKNQTALLRILWRNITDKIYTHMERDFYIYVQRERNGLMKL